MKFFLLKLLMRIAGGLASTYVEKVNSKLMNEWLMGLASEDSGYKHYYTYRKKRIMEGMVSGMTQEQYWINHGRILELQFINALSVKLIKDNNK
jgi:hypothetical protein